MGCYINSTKFTFNKYQETATRKKKLAFDNIMHLHNHNHVIKNYKTVNKTNFHRDL